MKVYLVARVARIHRFINCTSFLNCEGLDVVSEHGIYLLHFLGHLEKWFESIKFWCVHLNIL